MEDRFWATLLYMVTTMISFFASAIRFYLPGRQTLNEVKLFLIQNLFGAESSLFRYDLFLQLICTGKYYEEWRDEPKRAKLYDSIFPTCMVLHLLMVSIIKIKKIKSDKSVQPQTKIIDEDEESADQKGNRKIVNFGSLIIALIILCPMLGNAYFLTLVENRLDPMKLNEPPYNWYIYIIHFFNPTIIAFGLPCYYFVKSKELRRAAKETFGFM